MATSRDVGVYLEQHAVLGTPITYSAVIARFPDLPRLNGAWKSHPLCSMFGELDDEDARLDRPFRTALVYGQETGIPGQGFFDAFSRLRAPVSKSQQPDVWIAELNALFAFHKEKSSGSR